MRRRVARWIVAGAVPVLTLAACASVVDGNGTSGLAANANLAVHGDSHGAFDTLVKNSISDVVDFWKLNYPSIASGKKYPPLKGGLFSVDGDKIVKTGKVEPGSVNECGERSPGGGVVNNAQFCGLDDTVMWDRAPKHLVPALGASYGPLLVTLAFAHEFGHAISWRLGYFDTAPTAISLESQADCAAGAFLAAILHGETPHFRTTPQEVDTALEGYLLVRDPTPEIGQELSHGNGFDRIAAIADGLNKGPKFCFAQSYFDRKYTERPFVTDSDYAAGGNETLAQVLNANDPATDADAGGLQPDLNRFWEAKAGTINKSWKDVKIAAAAHPKCGSSASSKFGYCPADNTVYYDPKYAAEAYNSLIDKAKDSSGSIQVLKHEPADFALGTLFAVGWGLAVRSQLLGKSVDGADALLAAACYVGAYAKDINVPADTNNPRFLLSPPDMDEATHAMLTLVGSDSAFGARGTTGVQRIQAVVKGYNGGLSVC